MASETMRAEDQPNEDWPDKELLETALRKWFDDPTITVAEFTSRIATNKGDNYSSDMFRVIVNCEQRDDPATIIIKRLIVIHSNVETMEQATPYEREEQMLGVVLPKMHSVLKGVLPDVESFGAYLIYATPGLLMMEDLLQDGFRMAQRRLGLDLKHCSLVLRTLARYHAASVLLMERKSLDFSAFQRSLFGVPSDMWDNFCTGMVKRLAEVVKEVEVLKKYAPKLTAFAEKNFRKQIFHALEDREDDDFLILSHGDLWVNNILFRYSSSGELDGIRFVDFQLTCITSPCNDIQYFLTTSTDETVRTSCTDHLLEEYHNTLCQTMATLRCLTKPPTIEKLRQDYEKKTHYGMFGAFSVMPIVLSEPGQFALTDIMEGGNPNVELFRSKSYLKAMEWFLPLFERKGYL